MIQYSWPGSYLIPKAPLSSMLKCLWIPHDALTGASSSMILPVAKSPPPGRKEKSSDASAIMPRLPGPAS